MAFGQIPPFAQGIPGIGGVFDPLSQGQIPPINLGLGQGGGLGQGLGAGNLAANLRAFQPPQVPQRPALGGAFPGIFATDPFSLGAAAPPPTVGTGPTNGGKDKPKGKGKKKTPTEELAEALATMAKFGFGGSKAGELAGKGIADPSELLAGAFPAQPGQVFGPRAAGPVIFTGGSPVPIPHNQPSQDDIDKTNFLAGLVNMLTFMQAAKKGSSEPGGTK